MASAFFHSLRLHTALPASLVVSTDTASLVASVVRCGRSNNTTTRRKNQ